MASCVQHGEHLERAEQEPVHAPLIGDSKSIGVEAKVTPF